MMKINNLLSESLNFEPKKYRKNKKKVLLSKTNIFSSIIRNEQIKANEHFFLLENGEFNLSLIREILDNINNLGEKLLSEPSKYNVVLYKRSISDFLSMVISLSVTVKEQQGCVQNGVKRPKYRIIKIINEKLDKLAYTVIQNQTLQIKLLDSLEEIQGLLVDLLQ